LLRKVDDLQPPVAEHGAALAVDAGGIGAAGRQGLDHAGHGRGVGVGAVETDFSGYAAHGRTTSFYLLANARVVWRRRGDAADKNRSRPRGLLARVGERRI